ncbi:MAG: trehalose-phosphatase [Sphingobium sp.]
MSAATDRNILPYPPIDLLANTSLFIDFDGTLVDIADRPDDVVVDAELTQLLSALNDQTQGRLAIVSGRSVAQLDILLGPVAQELALSGSHGSEHRWKGISAHPIRPPSLDIVADQFQSAASNQPGALVEIKNYGVALHYRLAPEMEPYAHSLANGLAVQHGLARQDGKMMVELRVPGSDKGVAVRRMMQRPHLQFTRPIFIGDDVTDEPGFESAQSLNGVGILVGPERLTAAQYRLENPAATRKWLAGALA